MQMTTTNFVFYARWSAIRRPDVRGRMRARARSREYSVNDASRHYSPGRKNKSERGGG